MDDCGVDILCFVCRAYFEFSSADRNFEKSVQSFSHVKNGGDLVTHNDITKRESINKEIETS